MDLIEPDAELAALDSLLEAARAGGFLLLEAPAGQGKTALLHELRDRARSREMKVLSATAARLERDFPVGVVRQLFEAEFRPRIPRAQSDC